MTVAELGAIGEFVGSLAVIVTLIYLAIQVRQSKQLLQENQRIALSQTMQTRTGFRMETFRFGLDPHGAALLAKANALNFGGSSLEERMRSFDALSDGEKIQIRNHYSMGTHALDNTLYQGTLGLLDDEQLQPAWTAILENYPIWMHARAVVPGLVRKWYEANCHRSHA